MEKLKIPYPVIVEGKYDKIRLSSIIEGYILTTEGFGIFKQTERAALIRALARETPIIVLTDSDGAGRVIRSHISQLVPRDRLIQLYVPRIDGKERRKSAPSAEGTLGVEGIDCAMLHNIFKPFASHSGDTAPLYPAAAVISKTDFYIDGLSGGEDSSGRRDEFASKLGLPRGMTANALLAAVRMICTYEKYLALVHRESGKQ